jgi:hypothetical protein
LRAAGSEIAWSRAIRAYSCSSTTRAIANSHASGSFTSTPRRHWRTTSANVSAVSSAAVSASRTRRAKYASTARSWRS